jgi:hypothetical protein
MGASCSYGVLTIKKKRPTASLRAQEQPLVWGPPVLADVLKKVLSEIFGHRKIVEERLGSFAVIPEIWIA